MKHLARLVSFLFAAVLLPACIVGPGAPTTGGGTSGAPAGGSAALAGTWNGTWTSDGDHPLTFVVSSSGRVTGGTLIHPGGAQDQVTGGQLSLAGSTVTGNLIFNGYFSSASFSFKSANYASPGSISGSLLPTTPLTGFMSSGGPVILAR